MIKRFLSDETGAITVDWTVMTAAIVGLGLAATAAVRTGTGNLGTDIQTSLSNARVAYTMVSQNFADGNFAGWSRAVSTTFGAWGPMLGPFGNETLANPLTYDVSLPEGVSSALISFDLVIADSWDGVAAPGNPWTNALGDSLRFMVDGQVITGEHFVHTQHHPGGYQPGMFDERRATAQIGESTFNLVLTPRNLPSANINQSVHWWQDQRWNVQIEAVQAPQSFQLGFAATTDGLAREESFGIQNFNISGN